MTEKILKVGADGRSYRKEVGYRDACRLKSRFKSIFYGTKYEELSRSLQCIFLKAEIDNCLRYDNFEICLLKICIDILIVTLICIINKKKYGTLE